MTSELERWEGPIAYLNTPTVSGQVIAPAVDVEVAPLPLPVRDAALQRVGHVDKVWRENDVLMAAITVPAGTVVGHGTGQFTADVYEQRGPLRYFGHVRLQAVHLEPSDWPNHQPLKVAP